MSIARNILLQLGGSAFLAMTGARNLSTDGSGLSFMLPSNIAKRSNAVRITLNAMDLYDIEFKKIRGTTVKLVSEVENIHVENLRQVFKDHTGLDTSLGRR